jgi:hypothetical protein
MSRDDHRELQADEISWTPEPVPLLESIDLLSLDPDHVFLAARDLQQELAAMRSLVRAAVARVAQLTAQRDRQTEMIIRLHEFLRAQR